jgi:uncharacterized repeat protein (TIGR01451 family)
MEERYQRHGGGSNGGRRLRPPKRARGAFLAVALAVTCLGGLLAAGTAAASVQALQVQASFSPTGMQPNAVSTLTITITNPTSNAIPIIGVGFTDTFAAHLVVETPNGLTNTCGGTATATAGGTSFTLAGGTVAVSSSCTVTVNVTAAPTGSYPTSTTVTSSNAPSSAPAIATLTVANPPTISTGFSPTTIAANEPDVLSFTIGNTNTDTTSPNQSVNLTGISFSDALPTGLQIPNPRGGVTDTCGGTLTAPSGATSLSLTGGSLSSGSTCTISVEVEAATPDDYNNTTSVISANESGTGATSNTATLTVSPEPLPPTVDASFGSSQVNPGDTTSLTFDVSNPNTTTELDSITFQDSLPSGLVVSTPNALSGTCVTPGGAQIRAAAGSSTIRLLTVNLTGGSSCSFTVNVTVDQPGTVQNTTAEVAGSFNNGAGVYDVVDGADTTATMTVVNPVTVSQSFSAATVPLAQGTTLSFTLSNPAGGAVNGIGLTDTLSSGLVVASPNAVTGNCGATITATPGTGTISLSGANLGPNASCTFTVGVTATAEGAQTSDSTAPTANGESNDNTATASTSVGPPLETFTVTNLSVHTGGVVTLDVNVPGPGTVWVYETAPLRTFAIIPDDGPGDPGAGRFEFASSTQSVSASGTTAMVVLPAAKGAQLVAHHRQKIYIDAYVTYTPTSGTPATKDFLGLGVPGPVSTVPSNKFTISGATASPTGKLTFTVKVPDPGKISALETAGGSMFAKSSATAKKAGKVLFTVAPGSKGARLIAKYLKNAKSTQKHKKHLGKLTLRLSVTFTPTGGYARTKTVGGIPVPPATKS